MRDPVNELFDHANALAENAAAVKRGAVHRDATEVAAAVAGCLEVALRDLADAVSTLGAAADSAASGRRLDRMQHGFEDLALALHDAARAADAARAHAAPPAFRSPR